MKEHFVTAWGRRFLPAPPTVSQAERARAVVCAFAGLFLTFAASRVLIGNLGMIPILIAPMGASSVLVFCLPSSPLAQPWPVIGGNTIAALIAIACVKLVPDPLVAAPLALAAAIGVMFPLRCLHPPSGAVALTVALGGPAVASSGFLFALAPVGLNSAILVGTAIVLNSLFRHPYPHAQRVTNANAHGSADQPTATRSGISAADLDAVFHRYGEVLDISPHDMEALFHQVEMRAYERRLGHIRCADIMTRDVVAVAYGTPLQDAWSLLRAHDIWALPVVDPARRVIGILGREQFMRDESFDSYESIGTRLKDFILRPTTTHYHRPEAVGQIMASAVSTIAEDRPFIDLVPMMTDTGHRHIPVVDGERRLTGIISQSDLIAALYGSGIGDVLQVKIPSKYIDESDG